jgi:peptidoglycan/xylan/chitin deacetylase (PgdA/CDA1 family)
MTRPSMKQALLCAVFMVFAISSFSYSQTFAATNLIKNPSVQIVASGNPANWSRVKWGTSTTSFFVATGGANSTNRSINVQNTTYAGGDARWAHADVAVTPNTSYTASVFYRSNTTTNLLVDTTLTNGTHTYTWLNTNPATNAWTKIEKSFISHPQARSLNFYIALSSVGFVQTDEYSLTTPDIVVPPTSGFTRPLISIDFDDGWKSNATNGFPILNEFGFKGTAGIVTDTVINNSSYGDLYMNAQDVISVSNQGHRIASHSITHPNLITLSQPEVENEVIASKTYLQNLTGKTVDYFITPYCSYNAAVTQVVRQNYTSGMRNCDGAYNTAANYNRYNVRSFPVLNTTTLAEIQALIDQSRNQNAWLVLMYHRVDYSGDTYAVTPEVLRTQMQLVKNSNITVLPSQVAVAAIGL